MNYKFTGIVIAGTYQQYRHWLRENGQVSADWKYVTKESDLFGIVNLPILLVGTADIDKPKFIQFATFITQL